MMKLIMLHIPTLVNILQVGQIKASRVKGALILKELLRENLKHTNL